jgi:acetyl esterase/lipase
MSPPFCHRLLCALALSLALPLSAAELGVPPGVTFTKGIEYANPDRQHLQLDLALPAPTGGATPAILCIHGGGFRAGTRGAYDQMCLKLAQRGFAAATITYRLTPAYPFPAAVEDAKSAVRWLRLHAADYHLDPDRIGVTGSSAGAHLALFLGMTAGVKQFEGDQNPGPSSAVQCVVSFYGPTDFTLVYGHSVDAAVVLPPFLGGNLEQARPRHILASPINWVTPAAPPTLFVHGTADDYVPYGQAVLMRDRLAACGVDTDLVAIAGAKHGFRGADEEKAEQALFAFFQSHLMVPRP